MTTPDPALMALADKVAALGDITCPLCGETGFDVPGFVFSHDNWCEVRNACIISAASRNSEVAAAMRGEEPPNVR